MARSRKILFFVIWIFRAGFVIFVGQFLESRVNHLKSRIIQRLETKDGG
nr:MAG TPA: hypothetical protein [Caudoviricetes sp.]